MNPDDIIATIEGVNNIADLMESLRQALLAKGWTPAAAQHAAATGVAAVIIGASH